MRPASWASRDANNPAGIFGELRSHPEMMSKIANRTMPTFSLGFGKHLVAKALDLSHDSFNKFVKLHLDGTRSNCAQIDGFRHQPQQCDGRRVAVYEACCIQKVGDADLVRRQTLTHGVHEVLSVDPNQGSRGATGANGIDKNYAIRFREQSQQGQTERSSILQGNAHRDSIVALQARDCRGAKSIVAKQYIAKSQDEDADRLAGWPSLRIPAQEMPALRLDRNL
jgi:hypothetical protein